jgi:hypothetical protein
MPLSWLSAKIKATPEEEAAAGRGKIFAIVWAHGTLGRGSGTGVPFAKVKAAFTFASEQFWGRAARAPRSRKRFEALVILGQSGLRFRAWVLVLGLKVLKSAF